MKLDVSPLENIDTPIDVRQSVTVFCQGNGAGRYQAAKYAGRSGLDVITGEGRKEHVSMPSSLPFLYNIFPYADLNDVGYGETMNPLYLANKLCHWANQRYYGIEGASLPFNYPTMLNVGGDEDVTQYLCGVRECIHQHPKRKIVLFGCSRGAAVVLVSLSQLTTEERSHIALVIVEAPFASVSSVLAHAGPLGALKLAGLEHATRYQRSQMSPLDAVKHQDFPLHLPLAFITSESDTIVPACHTKKLIDVLRKRESHHLHHLKLRLSHHSMMPVGEERDEYFAFVQNLHKMYITGGAEWV